MARKAELVSRQIQLAERRAPTTILNVITASNGNIISVVVKVLV